MNRVMAFIALKEQSERVPGKNSRNINGKPLFYWVMSMLQNTDVVNGVIIDTDSEKMRERIESYFPDTEIHIRPDEIKGGLVSMNDVTAHNLRFFNDEDIILQTNVTNPLLSSQTVENAVEAFKDNDCDSLFSVNVHQNLFFHKDGTPINHELSNLKRTQDLDPIIEANHNIYIFKKKGFTKERGRIGEKPYMFAMNTIESLDIDHEVDFSMAEIILKNRDKLPKGILQLPEGRGTKKKML